MVLWPAYCVAFGKQKYRSEEKKEKKQKWRPLSEGMVGWSRQTDSDASALNFTICCFIAKRSAKEVWGGGGVAGVTCPTPLPRGDED